MWSSILRRLAERAGGGRRVGLRVEKRRAVVIVSGEMGAVM